MNDDLLPLLSPRPAAANEPTAQELLALTHSALSGRVRLQWLLRAFTAFVILAIGFGLGRISTPVKIETIALETPQPITQTVPVPTSREPSASELELQAELNDDPAEVAALYRKAGDKFLNDERDYPRATRCYRLYLQALDPKLASRSSDDTWLLASLKPSTPSEK